MAIRAARLRRFIIILILLVANGGEVITVNNWTAGQTYTAYVQDYHQ